MTTIQRWQQIKEVFLEALDHPENQRGDYIARACHADEELRSKVENLLALEHKATAFIEPPAVADLSIHGIAAPGQRIGAYKVVRVIASGGMGTVYEALQEDPERSVALNLLRPGLASESALRRFQYEARILARLRHPGIAQIYEAGMQESESFSIPYFAMEFIPDAKPIIEYAEEKRLSMEARLGLFLKVCQAIHHGHQKSVIHRDIKPSNILIDAAGEPKSFFGSVAPASASAFQSGSHLLSEFCATGANLENRYKSFKSVPISRLVCRGTRPAKAGTRFHPIGASFLSGLIHTRIGIMDNIANASQCQLLCHSFVKN